MRLEQGDILENFPIFLAEVSFEQVSIRDCHKLPDHRNRYGTGWWIDHDVTEWRCVLGED